MAFNTREISRWLGRPIHLLRLSRGSLLELYTTDSVPTIVGAETYLPLAISRSRIRDSAERQKAALQITIPLVNKADTPVPAVAWWHPHPPGTTVGVTWLAKHHGDAEVVVEWSGRVVGPRFNDSQMVLNCEPTKTDASSRGLVLVWMRGCPLPLYSIGLGMCNVDKALHAVPGTVADFTGAALQVAAFAAAPKSLAGGFVTWLRPDGEPEFRSVMAHTLGSDLVVLQYGSDQLPDGTAITGYPGCPHNKAGCASFGNTPNYGGAEYMPNKSVFNGNPR